MIPPLSLPWSETAWRDEFRQAIRDTETLEKTLDLNPRSLDWDDASSFPLRVPRGYVSQMRRGDPSDPLLLQVAPRLRERFAQSGFEYDALHERSTSHEPGVLKKYSRRVLVIASGSCAVHCRYCFRRHYPYTTDTLSRPFAGLTSIANDPTVSEVILSGGDPLSLSDSRLVELVSAIDGFDHVKRIRFHTRVPVVIPQRITRQLLSMIQGLRTKPVIVFHFNHPNEIVDATGVATNALRDSGASLLNQTVLLRDVNDSAATLADLSERLFDIHVLPYYLHLLDRVHGTGHFEVPVEHAQTIFGELRSQLPGYLVPRLVQEIPGQPSKSIIGTAPA